MRLRDLTGRRFGMLTVIKRDVSGISGRTRWLCLCDCGGGRSFDSRSLLRGSESCGCLTGAKISKSMTKHGMSHSKVHSTWLHMRRRCSNPNNHAYERYGGRGITVCERWINSFENFFEDMGLPPKGLTIDRINNNDGYYPENCKWSTYKEQASNRRPSSKQKWFVGVHPIEPFSVLGNNKKDFSRHWGISVKQLYRCLSGKIANTKGWIFYYIGGDHGTLAA